MLLLALLADPALAVRPTEGGMFSFDATDVVASWDEPSGRVRVHYSVEGPNVVKQGDDDESGVPDFAEEVGLRAAEVLDFFEHDLGLRPPIAESEMGLGELGGSDALDFYLVDFGGNADGMFGIDGCTEEPYHCVGHMVMENDFKGYGYWSTSDAITVLTSHELFHAVQAAYDAGQPSWFSEGTAVWAELQFDPDSDDFRWFADAYLEDCGRSLDRPPSGPVPSFSYGTALFWEFLTTRHDTALMHELLLATEGTYDAPVDTIAEVEAAVGGREDALRDAWTTFTHWNLATGDRAGIAESYAFAADLDGVAAEMEGATLEDDNRFYPLAATYYRLDHPGGDLWFAAAEDATPLHFGLHPVSGGGADGVVEPPVLTWSGTDGVATRLLEGLPAGGYWLVGTYPEVATQSTKVRFCLGDAAAAEVCAPIPADTGDTGDDEEPGGCGCASGGGAVGPWWLLALGWMRRRRG